MAADDRRLGLQRIAAVIPAAGAGVRMGAGRPKQYLDLCGYPVLALTLDAFQAHKSVDEIVLVVPPGDVAFCRRGIVRRFGFDKVSKVMPGGATRQESVWCGLSALPAETGIVLIHDGVRPFVDSGLLDRLLDAAGRHRAVVPGLPPDETVKRVDASSGTVRETLERSSLRMVQTPQVFRFADVMAAHCRAREERWEGITDDAMLLERSGIPVTVVEGSKKNIKVTSPLDLEWARFLAGEKVGQIKTDGLRVER